MSGKDVNGMHALLFMFTSLRNLYQTSIIGSQLFSNVIFALKNDLDDIFVSIHARVHSLLSLTFKSMFLFLRILIQFLP